MQEFDIDNLPVLRTRYKDLIWQRHQTFVLTDVFFVISGVFFIVCILSWSKCNFSKACTIPYGLSVFSGWITLLNLLLVLIQISAHVVDTKYCKVLDAMKKPKLTV